jgi:hypothetical protein
MTEKEIVTAYLDYAAAEIRQRRINALAHAIYQTPWGTGDGLGTLYGPNSSRTWAAQGLKALERVGNCL